MKSLSAAWMTALQQSSLIPRLFFNCNLASGIYGFWNDGPPVALNGVTYYGSGALGSVQSISGVSDMSVPGLTCSLSGIDAEALSTFFNETWHQRAGQVSIGLLDPATRNLVDTPDLAFDGFMDNAELDGGAGNQATLTITLEDASRLATRTFANVRSDADQRERDPDDTFFQYDAVAAQRPVYWNQPTPATEVGTPAG